MLPLVVATCLTAVALALEPYAQRRRAGGAAPPTVRRKPAAQEPNEKTTALHRGPDGPRRVAGGG
jgi:hypothetical protein